MKDKIIAVCGPTASGKTSVSIELAKILGAEIISADSMQIYKELNIGTAKPAKNEMAGIPHHLIDILSVADGGFCVAEYVKMAGECILDIKNRGKNAVVCGGTGLYLDHFLNNTQFTEYENDTEYRKQLESLSNEELYSMLKKTDFKSFENIHKNNKKRIIRALEIFKITGKTKSELDGQAASAKPKYDHIKFVFEFSNREALYLRINLRVDQMIKNGLPEEARGLYEKGLKEPVKKIGAIGYFEFMDHFDGLYTFEQTVEKIKQHTRNYAKRQITWFKKDPEAVRIHIDPSEDYINNYSKIIKNCLNYIKS